VLSGKIWAAQDPERARQQAPQRPLDIERLIGHTRDCEAKCPQISSAAD